MSRSVNSLTLIGNVGADPEVKDVGSGDSARAVANFSVATSRQWKDGQGNKHEETQWHRCTAWGPLADVMDKYVRKGDKLYIQGRVEYRKWTDKDGVERYSTDVQVNELVMLSAPKGNGTAATVRRPADGEDREDYQEQDVGAVEEFEEPSGEPARDRGRGAGRGNAVTRTAAKAKARPRTR